MTSKPRNARFWTFENGGPVKLTLKPGQSLSHSSGGPDDDGWHWEGCTWTHEGDHVHREWGSRGKDCDGILERYGEDVCHLDDLRTYEPCVTDEELATKYLGVLWPHWDHQSSGQYDQYAEMAGY